MKTKSYLRFLLTWIVSLVLGSALTLVATAQTVTIVGTQHLQGFETPPTQVQYAHAIDKLSAFKPTQICIERMSGSRLQTLAMDPMRNATALSPNTHRRPLGTLIIPLGVEMQARLAVLPADAREAANDLVPQWDQLGTDSRLRIIGFQIAGYEFHSAVLNWSYLDTEARNVAAKGILEPAVEALDEMLFLHHEAYALAVPLARRAGLHTLCTADVLEYEVAGIEATIAFGGQEILDNQAVKDRLEAYSAQMDGVWQPDSGPEALTRMLAYMNSTDFAEFDFENQWEMLRKVDNDAGAFHRRLMYWHARTAQISSELYSALAQGPEERVLLIIGAAHRPFNEAEMRSQPWLTVEPASVLLGEPKATIREP